MNDNVKDWITINGNHIPVKEGQTKSEVVNNFLKEKADKGKMRIKKGLKKTEDIADYFEKKLKDFGIEVERKHSGLSGSEYIIIKNEGDKFGKADVDDVEIRIADHNLPPSYDKQYAGDFDVRSNGVERNGTNGDANDYDEILKKVISKIGKKEIKKEKVDKSGLPEWQKTKDGLKNKLEELHKKNIDAYLYLKGYMSGSVTDTQKKLKEFKEWYDKETDEDIKNRFKDLVQ
jgi:hypothetical protein